MMKLEPGIYYVKSTIDLSIDGPPAFGGKLVRIDPDKPLDVKDFGAVPDNRR